LNGQRWTSDGYVPTSTTSDFDGDGNRIRETSDGFGYMTTTYYLRSGVLGGAIVEDLNSSGQKQLGYVYTPAGGLLARQVPGQDYVLLKQVSPIGASQYEFFVSSTVTGMDSRRELDPAGANVPLNNHTSLGHGGNPGDIPDGGGGASDYRFSALENPGAGCTLDGVWVPCSMAYRSLEQGSGVLGPENTTRYNYTKQRFEFFRAFADGYSGWVLSGAAYMGNGYFIAPGGWDNEEELLEHESDNSLLYHHPQHIAARASPCVEALAAIAPGVVGENAGTLLEESRLAGLSAAQTAYVFASAQHETDQGRSMVEYASGEAYEGNVKSLGNTEPGDGPRFRGRGFVQLTGRKNYKLYSDLLDVDLVANPDLAAGVALSAHITVDGMANGRFTGVALSRYINSKKTDFKNARAVVNGDVAKNGDLVGGYAQIYLKALEGCGYGLPPLRIR
jgi:hypothetical protein